LRYCVSVFAKYAERFFVENNHCAEKTKLLNAYEQATLLHSDAVTRLRSRMGKLSRPDYEMAYRETEQLRMAARAAQELLHRHTMAHGC
jgi:hypothetical protein